MVHPLGAKIMKTLSKDCNRYIITDQRETGDLMEKQIASAFNIIGISIHRAMQLTEFATQEKIQTPKGNTTITSYTWIPRNEPESETALNTTVEKVKNANTIPGLTCRCLPTHDDGKG